MPSSTKNLVKKNSVVFLRSPSSNSTIDNGKQNN